MAITYSPKIVIDGLVCYYDMVNTRKSFIGAPTTNLCSFDIASAGFSTDSPGNLTQSANSTEVTYEGRLTRKMIIPAAGYCNYYIYNYNTGVSSTVFTASCKIKVSDSSNPSAFINAGYLYGTAGSFVVGVSFTALADGWYLVYWSYSGTAMTLNSLTGLTGTASATKTFYIVDYQVEALSVPSTFAGVSGGTRSSTQAILDLMNKNTFTATSLTYAANNTFSFNGSSNRITITCGPSLIQVFNSTTEFIINLPTYSGGQLNILSYRSGGGGALYIGKGSGGIFTYYDSLSSPGYTAGSIVNGTTAHCAVVCDALNSLILIYINGVLAGSASRTGFVSTFATSLSLGYDAGTGEYMSGSMYQFKHYNRVLSAAEIAQNFNATRSRYGI